ncbi:BTAD domain-containing putative transcriptional regulator [Nonomuraea sp. C10]|uniref:ATP-binding protein n=1 Tax=Nonomuraea sp. C10 TaxID=2600577 RepID=UPI0021C4A6BA|nr:BTAD domain-containing putative transcriptional regulator [Nonomuraea sp. C10]
MLTLLDGVRWQGTRVAGERAQTLLAVLALHGRAGAGDERLVEELWPDGPPANPTKALQVVVSRTRAATSADAVVRTARGYRLGVPDEQVDALLLGTLVERARKALTEGDVAEARRGAEEAMSVASGLGATSGLATAGGLGATSGLGTAAGPLGEVRAVAAGRLAEARRVSAVARSRAGDHEGALPLLEEAAADRPRDEELLACLLRGEAAVRGTAAALERYERHRADLAERLGADPGPALARVHAELLAADRPVREGVLFDGSSLLGRDGDISAVHALLQTHRVVSVVGPGGLGKTRLAHVVGRNATQPVVHFVGLVGVSSPEGVVGEVGSALGVRDSVSGRGMPAFERPSDVRARIAQHLGRAPALLILDNCEHVIDAVAELTAFLAAATRDLRVLTTSRAPLSIPAEHVYPLGALEPGDAVELFRQRATAARPGVRLDEGLVREVVTRLDGLPLAIELAAAKVRVMAVEEIARRLADRFALLRGGDRSAPGRHQTLLAVIDWSWNLLDEPERRALRRLSLFSDGFTAAAAEAMGALDAVQALAEQSLLSVDEAAHGVRYRMLETVREFGRVRLEEAGEEVSARAALLAWATGYAHEHAAVLFGPDQFAAVDALRAEETNLADLLRRALAEPDPATAVPLLAGVGALWSIRGDHARIIALRTAIIQAVTGWFPPPELVELTRAALVVAIANSMILLDERSEPLHDLLSRLPVGDATDPRLAAMTKVTLIGAPSNSAGLRDRLRELCRSADRDEALVATQMSAHVLENAGDIAEAVTATERGLALLPQDEGPWLRAILHTTLAHLTLRCGDRRRAVGHARAALPVLSRIGATDDETQLRSLLLIIALGEGDHRTAEAELAQINRLNDGGAVLGGLAVAALCAAELALARGETAAALSDYRLAVERARDLRLPGMPRSGFEPWVVTAEALALAAHAYHGEPADLPYGEELFRFCVAGRARDVLSADGRLLDYPVSGSLLFALGAWGLLRAALAPGDAVALLVLAERFAYNGMMAGMAFDRIEPYAEQVAPGALARVRAGYGDRRGADLLDEARALVGRLAAGQMCRL